MKFIPMLFSTPMVKAILECRKTMTRRAVKELEVEENTFNKKKIDFVFRPGKKYVAASNVDAADLSDDFLGITNYCPYGNVGDVLWVRETWQNFEPIKGLKGYSYKASALLNALRSYPEWKWKPSIFMPKDACRIFLEITDIKVERLHDISEEDAKAEGVLLHKRGEKWLNYMDEKGGITQLIYNCRTAKESFKTLWTLINGFRDEPYAWYKNPFVWCVSFKRIEKPDNF